MSYIPPPPNDPYGQVPPPPPAYQPYGAPSYGGYAPNQAAYSALEGRSTTILVLGILSLVFCALLGPFAWSMGNKVRDEAAAMGRAEPGNSKAGRICGIIGTCIFGVSILMLVLFAVIGIAAGSGGSG